MSHARASVVALLWCALVALLVVWVGNPTAQHSTFAANRNLDSNSEDNEWTKKLFSNPGSDILGSLLAFITVCVASAGGIGGGGLLVPLYILVLQLDRFAIPLSKATIFGSSVSNLYLNLQKRHPQVDRPLIAFDVALILEPMTLAGTIVGVLFNTIFPSWLITLLLILLLGYTTKKTLAKGLKAWKQETLNSAGNVKSEVQVTELQTIADKDDVAMSSTTNGDDDDELAIDHEGQRRERAVALIRNSERHIKYSVVLLLVGTWIVVFVTSLLKGGHGAPSVVGMECNSAAFWFTTLIAIGSMIGVTYFCAQHLNAEFAHKSAIGYQFTDGDVQWNDRNSKLYPFICSLAGIAAGLLGIGGGMVKSPLMLEMGMRSDVTAATSVFMIFFTSSATTMQFLILGMLRLDYTLWYGFVGFCGAYVGQKVVTVIIKRYGRPSVVVFALALIIGLSTVVMGILGIIQVISDMSNKNWDEFDFHPLCSH